MYLRSIDRYCNTSDRCTAVMISLWSRSAMVPCHPQNPVVSPGAVSQTLDECPAQQLLGTRIHPAIPPQQIARQVGIAPDPKPRIALCLDAPWPPPPGHGCRRWARRPAPTPAFSYSTGCTPMCRSIRSSSGPEIRCRYWSIMAGVQLQGWVGLPQIPALAGVHGGGQHEPAGETPHCRAPG